jgi:hypothetical protein
VDNIIDATIVGLHIKWHNTTKFANYYANKKAQNITTYNGNLNESLLKISSL